RMRPQPWSAVGARRHHASGFPLRKAAVAMQHATWHGTARELDRLEAIAQAYCSCEPSGGREGPGLCAPHRLFGQQRVLDRLLFVRRTRHQFMTREFTTEGGSSRTHGTIEPCGL